MAPLPHYFWRPPWGHQNLGDFVSVPILRALGHTPIFPAPDSPCLFASGSILGRVYYHEAGNPPSVVVWGSGAGYDPDGLLDAILEVLAVRGPLTRQLLGIDPVTPLGDPALLLTSLFPRGVLPNCGPHDHVVYLAQLYAPDLTAPPGTDQALSTLVTPDNWQLTVSHLANASFVLTQSLHGAIIAQAYGVPWAPCSATPIPLNRFKWADWLNFLGLTCPPAFTSTLAEGKAWWSRYGPRIVMPNTRPFLDSLLRRFPHAQP